MPSTTLDAESLALSPADIIRFGEDSGADPKQIAAALQEHRDNIVSWSNDHVDDPADWWSGVQKLDNDTTDGLQKMRTGHLRNTVAKELPDEHDQQNFLYELQASGFDLDSMPEEFKPVVDAYKGAMEDSAFTGARRRVNGKIRNGDQTLAYFDMVDNGEGGKSIDAVLKYNDGKSEKLTIPNATEKDAQDEAARLLKAAADTRSLAKEERNPNLQPGEESGDQFARMSGAEALDAQAFDLERQASYLKDNGRIGLITNRVREALKDPSRSDKVGQGLLAGLGGEFAKGLASASIDLGILNQRIQGDEKELKQLVEGKQELDTAIEGASRTKFAGNLVSRGVASGVESLGTMAPFLAGGLITRGLSSAATRAAMDTGRLGVVGAGMGAESAGAAYGEAEQLAQQAEKAGDTARAARIRAGRDLYAITQAVVETATERIGRLQTLKGSGRGMRTLAKDMIQEGPIEEGVAGLVEGGLTRPLALGQQPDISQVPEAMIGGAIAAVPLAGGAMLLQNQPSEDTSPSAASEVPPVPPAPAPAAATAPPPMNEGTAAEVGGMREAPPMPEVPPTPAPAAEAPPPSFVAAAGIAATLGGTEAAKHVAAAQNIVDSVVPPTPETAPVATQEENFSDLTPEEKMMQADTRTDDELTNAEYSAKARGANKIKRVAATKKNSGFLADQGVDVEGLPVNTHITSIDQMPDGGYQVRLEKHTASTVVPQMIYVRAGDSINNPGFAKSGGKETTGTVIEYPDGTVVDGLTGKRIDAAAQAIVNEVAPPAAKPTENLQSEAAGVVYDLRSPETGEAMDLDSIEMGLENIRRKMAKGVPIDWARETTFMPNTPTASVFALKSLLSSEEGIQAIQSAVDNARKSEAAPAANETARAAPAPVVSDAPTQSTGKEGAPETGDTQSLSGPLPTIPAPSPAAVNTEPTIEDAKKVVADLQNPETGNGPQSLDQIEQALNEVDAFQEDQQSNDIPASLRSTLPMIAASPDGRAMMRAVIEQAREQETISPDITAAENQQPTGSNTTDENAIPSEEGRQGQGRQEVLSPPAATPAQTVAENAPSAQPTIARNEKFKDNGLYDVEMPDGTKYQIFRDPENKYWYLEGSSKIHFSERVISTETRADALSELEKRHNKGDSLLKRVAINQPSQESKPERRGGRKLPKIIKTLSGPTGDDKTHPHVLDYLYRNPIPLPPESTRKGRGEWDWLGTGENKSIPSYWFWKNLIFRETNAPTGRDITSSIDVLKEAGYFPGIAHPTPEDLGRLIQSGVAEWDEARKMKGQPSKEQQRESTEEEQLIDFEKATESGPIKLDPNELATGDKIIIEGEQATVTSVEFDEDGRTTSFTIRDGTKFGVQTVHDGHDAIYVDDYQPTERGTGEFAPEDLQAEKAQAKFDLGGEEEFGRSTRTDATEESADDPFERAMDGDEAAFDEMDEAFRERFPQEPLPETEELRSSQKVFTPAAFARLFDVAFAAKDFDSIIDAVKVSDKGTWVPLLKKFFAEQGTSAEAAAKAEWMRHVFNGTRPPDAKAPATPPPPQPSYAPPPKPGAKTSTSGGGTTTGTPPPKKPKPPKPPPPPRIPVAPIKGGKAKSLYQIINDFSKAVGKFYHRRKMKPSQLGFYRPGSTLTAGRFRGDLDTTAHELAGHWTDDKYGLGRPWMAPKAKSPYDAELAKFWIHGSPERLLKRKRAEGIAEWIRAYIMNPAEAVKQAPNFAKYVEQTLPKDAMDALNQFSEDVRTWAGEDPVRRSSLNVRLHPPTLLERLQSAILGDKREFDKTFVDRFRSWFDDSYHYAVKGWETALRMQGKSPETARPSDNFNLMLRLLSSHDARLSEQLETGLVPLRPKQVVRNGKIEVQQLTDPVTGEKMNLEWLLGAFDTSSQEAMDRDMRETSGVMVAQRTLEKAAQIDRDAQAAIDAIDAKDPTKPRKTARILSDAEHKKNNISGLGGGLMADVDAARETMADLASDPARARRILESARRYREWADRTLDYLVDSGLKSKEEVAQIRKENRQYVDMHRLTEEYESASARARGPWGMTGRDALGKVSKVIHRFRGSTLEIDNVYKNLMGQTDRIQKEAIRNTVMQTFTKALQTSRKLYEGDPVELDRIGSEAKQEDTETVAVWENGKPTHWKFDPDIFETLKGMGDLGSHVLIDVASIPQSVTRYLITHSPQFMLRNPIRDTAHRAVVSETGNKPWDVLQGFSKEERTRLNIFGGGQFGNYAKDRLTWNRALKQGMQELRKDRRNIITTPLLLKRAWEKLAESSETVGRVSEMRSAYRHAIDDLKMNHDEAALYAAYESRSLMDYAKMGTWMRNINRLIPFSNAHIRGLTRTFREMRKNPAAFAARFSLYVVLPSLLVNALAHQGDYEEEYMQLPAWQRDFFWNIKLGPYWLRLPKPHELGVMASGVERMIDRFWYGKKNTFEGYGGSISNALLPFNSVADLGGPAKTPIEMAFNYDTFRNSYIIPPREKELNLELRKGTKHASNLGKALGGVLNADPRMMDHFLQSYGGFGQMATDFTNPDMRFGQALLKSTGLTAMPPSTQSLNYQWVMDWAKKNGASGLPNVDYLRDLIEPVYKAASAQEADDAAKRLRERATALRQSIEAGEVVAPEMADKSALIPKDAYKTTKAMDKLADAGLFFGQPDAKGRKIDLPGPYSRDMTEAEAAKYHTAVGNAYRIYAQQNADALLAMPKDKAAERLKKDLELIRELSAPGKK